MYTECIEGTNLEVSQPVIVLMCNSLLIGVRPRYLRYVAFHISNTTISVLTTQQIHTVPTDYTYRHTVLYIHIIA